MPTSGEDTQTVNRQMTCTRPVRWFGMTFRCEQSWVVEVFITLDDWASFECRDGHTTEFKWEGPC